MASLGLAAVLLGGCFGGGLLAQRGSYKITYDESVANPGTTTFEPPGKKVRGLVTKGKFRTTRVSASTVRVRIGSGRYVAKLDGVEDHSIGKATLEGLMLVKFTDRDTGRSCIRLNYSTTNHGQTYTGTFRTVGGSRNAARVSASGTFTESRTGQNEFTVLPGGKAKEIRARRMGAACRALASL
jgi:hypothetical protein